MQTDGRHGMPDLLLDGIPVIDLLEITASTSIVATLTRRDQSSVSRIYRQASHRLGLAFHKDPHGVYRAKTNLALLHDLRRSSQRLRLQDPLQLRWLSDGGWSAIQPTPLPRRGAAPQRICELVRERLLDLALLPGRDLLPPHTIHAERNDPISLQDGVLIAWPLQRPWGSSDLMVQRADLPAEQPLRHLQQAIRAAHRHALEAAEPVEWRCG